MGAINVPCREMGMHSIQEFRAGMKGKNCIDILFNEAQAAS